MTPREVELTRQLEAVLRENALLRQKIDLLVRRVFGSTSERLSPDQLELLALAETAPVATAPIAEKPRSSKRFPGAEGPRPAPARASARRRGSPRTGAGEGRARAVATHR